MNIVCLDSITQQNEKYKDLVKRLKILKIETHKIKKCFWKE